MIGQYGLARLEKPMGIVEFNPSRYRLDYVPQRLRALEVCVLACHSLLSGKADVTPLVIDLGSSQINQDTLKLFIDLSIDAGLVANRTLLNFMGIKLENGGLSNVEDDVTISHFGLAPVSVSIAEQILLPTVPESYMRGLWVRALTTASKSVAHFTERGAVISAAGLGYACYATSKLVRKYFYDALVTEAPIELLNPDVQPKHGTCWDAVEPQYMY
jgi:hypothetical protein